MSDIWILYQTTNICNGKIYVGVHKVTDTPTSRHYLGSGNSIKAAIKKYGKDNFTRVTLAEFSCAKDAYEAEANMVTEEFFRLKNTYNMCVGGRGGVARTPEIRAKVTSANKGKTLTKEHIAILVAANTGNKYNVGKKLPEKHRENIRVATPLRKPVIINGKYYISGRQAAKLEQVTVRLIQTRVRNLRPEWSEYRFATEEEIANFSAGEVEGE
jgi:hypothetical protein